MSIALSVRVGPSRALRLLLGAGGLALCAAALAVGSGGAARFHWAPLQGLVLALAGAALLGSAMARVKTHRIDISGTGDLSVTVQQDVDAGEGGRRAGAQGAVSTGAGPTSVASRLLPGTIAWPLLIVLRHAAPGAPARTLLVARDSVDAAAWRALTVALAVARRAAMHTTDATTR